MEDRTLQDNPTVQIKDSISPLLKDEFTILSEDYLLSLSKGPLSAALKCSLEGNSSIQERYHEQIWDTLLHIAADSSVSGSHLTAACNALSGYLGAARSSESSAIRKFAQRQTTWSEAFRIYLQRYDDGKPKVMRQLLSTLSQILSKHSEASTARSIQAHIVESTIPILCSAGGESTLKPTISAIDLLLRKDCVTVDQFARASSVWLDQLDPSLTWNNFSSGDGAVVYSDIMNSAKVLADGTPSVHYKPEPALHAFFAALLANCVQVDLVSTAAQFLSTVLTKVNLDKTLEPIYQKTFYTLWILPLKRLIGVQEKSWRLFKHYLYPNIFRDRPIEFMAFAREIQRETSLYLCLLEVGKSLNYVEDFHDQDIEPANNRSRRPIQLFSNVDISQYLPVAAPDIRLAALSLLVISSQSASPIPQTYLANLYSHLLQSHTDADPEVRSDILSLERRLIERIRGIMMALKRKMSSPRVNDPQVATAFRNHKLFLEKYIHGLREDLSSTSSYQQHICALKSLTMTLRSGLDSEVSSTEGEKATQDHLKWPIEMRIFDEALARDLLDLLLDPFEDVRAAALLLLKMAPPSNPVLQPEGGLRAVLVRAKERARRTTRADHADGLARIYDLYFHFSIALSDTSDIAATRVKKQSSLIIDEILSSIETCFEDKEDSGHNDQMISVHGYLSALRYLVSYEHFYWLISDSKDQFRSIHHRIMKVCENIWNGVRHILCIDSPEGQADEEGDYDLGSGPKDLLSASWRALKESSLLLLAVLSNPTYAPASGNSKLENDDYDAIGQLCFSQLAELRHRGAFSTVSQTFALCCRRCDSSGDQSRSLLEKWLKQSLIIIEELATKLTRRSAGIPAIITGIVAANPGGLLFRTALEELQHLAGLPSPILEHENGAKLPQVHALNCLKDIFTNTRLGSSTEYYIGRVLNLCVESLESERWAIKNCGLMLFQAIIGRMSKSSNASNGGSRDASEDLPKISFIKFPQLNDIIPKLLLDGKDGDETNTDSRVSFRTQKVFVALDLVRRRRSSMEKSVPILEAVLYETGSKIWAIREQAAKAYASQIDSSDYTSALKTLLRREWQDSNAVHGGLLCIKAIVSRLEKLPRHLSLSDDLVSILRAADRCKGGILAWKSPYIHSKFWEIVCNLVELVIMVYDGPLGSPLSDEPETGISIARNKLASTKKPRFLFGFNVPSVIESSLTLNVASFLRFLCLCYIFDPPSEPFASWAESVLSPEINATKVLTGFEEIFVKSYPAFDVPKRREAVYTSFLEIVRPEEHQIVILENLAELYQQMPAALGASWVSKIGESNSQSQSKMLEKGNGVHFRSRAFSDVCLRLKGTVSSAIFSDITGSDDRMSVKTQGPSEKNRQFRNWVRELRLAGNAFNEFPTRYSAIQSVEASKHILRHFNMPLSTSAQFLGLYLVIYDTLNDDDEEVRGVGAAVVSWVLPLQANSGVNQTSSPHPLVAPAAKLRLVDFIFDEYASSTALFREAVGRVIGHRSILNADCNAASLRSFKNVLYESRLETNDLFVEEKQNLYIDEAQEIDTWSEKLARLPSNSFDETLIDHLMAWATDGMSLLSSTVKEVGDDGPLGWISDPDVFVVGLRLLACVRLLLIWTPTVGSGAGVAPLLEGLRTFVEVGQPLQVHHKWIHLANSTLSSAEQRTSSQGGKANEDG